jgi:DNA recombination protein RmuC
LQVPIMPFTILLAIGAVVVVGLIYFSLRKVSKAENNQLVDLQQKNHLLSQQNDDLRNQVQTKSLDFVRVETQNKALYNQIDEMKSTNSEHQTKIKEAFNSAASQALETNNKVFLDLADSLMKRNQAETTLQLSEKQQAIQSLLEPMQTSLQRVDRKIEELEKARITAYEGLQSHLTTLVESQHLLRSETSNLVRALRSPSARGRWGELQLKRVVELSGMLEHCDFYQQVSASDNSEETITKRPDLIVKLPGGKNIVVDAKTPLIAFMEAQETDNELVRKQKLLEHAGHVRRHVQQLSQKSYWEQFQPSPEFVVLFLPGEQFFSAALEQDPTLIEAGVEQKVIIATPTTLIALLRAIAYGWRQEVMQEHAAQIAQLGKTLYQRLGDFGGHMTDLSRHLANSVKSYNKMIGSYDKRVMVTARKFHELKVHSTELPETKSIDVDTRAHNDTTLSEPHPAPTAIENTET